MSSNEPLSDETRKALEQALNTLNPELLQTVISTNNIQQALDVSFLNKALKRCRDPYLQYGQVQRKSNVLLIVFDNCHYPEQQRFASARLLIENALKAGNTPLITGILSRLDPAQEFLPLATHLLQTRFVDFCRNPSVVSQLFQAIATDGQQALCRQFLAQLQQLGAHKIREQLYQEGLPDPFLKILACFLSQTPDPESAALSDDWETIFARMSSRLIYSFGNILVTAENLASLLVSFGEGPIMDRLQILSKHTGCCFQQLGKNADALQNVLQLLPKSQRVQLFLLKTIGNKSICEFVADALWPLISPLLEPSDLTTILRTVVTHYNNQPVSTLINTLPIEEIGLFWQRLQGDEITGLLKKPAGLVGLLNQLPTDVQQSAREQFLAHLFLHHRTAQIDFDPWLRSEWNFSALFPAASQWLQKTLEKTSFDLRLVALAVNPTARNAFLTHLPITERNILITWFMNTYIRDVDSLNDLLNQHVPTFHIAYILPNTWRYMTLAWCQKMPLFLAILKRLPTHEERSRFARESTGWASGVWVAENHQAVRRAHELFGLPANEFLTLVGLDGKIPFPPLIQAVHDNDWGKLEEHLSSLNEQDLPGKTALMHAYHRNNMAMASYLAGQPGCDFSIRTLNGTTVFEFAAATGDTYALQHLMRISGYQPDACDALAVLYRARDYTGLVEFLFESCLPGVAWQHALSSYPDNLSCWYQSSSLFRTYYAKATLPFDLRRNQLSELTLSPYPPGIFKYQMQALGIDARQAMNPGYLLQALTARALHTLHLSDFYIAEHDLQLLSDFIKNNPKLKVLSVGTLQLHLEKAQIFAKTLQEVAQETSVELTIHGQPKIQIRPVKVPVRGVFFEHPVTRETETQASCSLRRL